jgi:aspartyl/asparaginyl-tRNA synthetase
MSFCQSNLGLVADADYDYVVSKLREFFKSRGFREVHSQSGRSILAACEDPETMTTYGYEGKLWPLPQTGQMWLEEVLLKNPEDPAKGLFCVTTSYRNEPNPVEGRHDLIFPLFEFETRGGMDTLLELEKSLLRFLGYPIPEGFADYPEGDYLDVVKEFNQDYGYELEHEHETKLGEKYGPVFCLKHFPEYTSPFWNMKMNEKDKRIFDKVDVLLSGVETIGSAVRSCNAKEMRYMFDTISDGKYATRLFATFSKKRTNEEMDDYLSLNFFERCGGGIGVTRLIKSMRKEGLIPSTKSFGDH